MVIEVMHQEFPTSELRKPKLNMRKYYQLTLVVISAISVILLLIYRHEYNHLRYVVEVLSFFGTPGQNINGNDCLLPNLTHLNYDILGFREHLPAWQRVSSTYSVYSAFWEKNEGRNHVKAIGVGVSKSHLTLKCQVWFKDVSDPVPGKFSYMPLDEKNGVVGDGIIAHFLFCKPPATIGTPLGVSFYAPANVPFKPFIPVESVEDRALVENSTVLCVSPSLLPSTSRSQVVEFLGYHKLVGINDFIIYDKTLPGPFPMVLQSRIVQERFNIRVLFLPWNFPYLVAENEKAVKLAVEKDCMMRAMGKVRNIVVLSWNEYIISKIYPSFSVMLEHLDSGRKSTGRFAIPVHVFCTDVPDDPQADGSMPLAVRKTKRLKSVGLDKTLYVYRPQLVQRNRTSATQFVSQAIATIHRYTQCFSNVRFSEEKLLDEPTVLKFAADLKRSKFLRAAETNKLLQ